MQTHTYTHAHSKRNYFSLNTVSFIFYVGEIISLKKNEILHKINLICIYMYLENMATL
jgi:hypothetical protein